MTKKGNHAIDFAIYASDWYYVYSQYHGEHMYRNAPEGWVPNDCALEIITPEQLYKKFLKSLKKVNP